MTAPARSTLDANQCIQGSFDEETGALRVEGIAMSGAIEVIIDASTDNIQIRDPNSGNNLAIGDDGSAKVTVQSTLVTEPFDYIGASYPSSTQEVYEYLTGGSGGTLVATITVNYTDTTKNFILNVART